MRIADLATGRLGVARPQGTAWDIGPYELRAAWLL